MDCICRTTCQARLDDGYIKFFNAGDIGDFKECPIHFEVLGGEDYVVNFETAGQDELMEVDLDLAELKKYILDTYGKRAGAKGKAKTIDMLMDCRYRDIR